MTKGGWKKNRAASCSRRRSMSVADKHQLRVAKKTINMPDAMVNIMGGMTKEEAKAVILRLTGSKAKDYYPGI